MKAISKGWDKAWTGLADVVKNVWNKIIGSVCGGVNKAIDLINDLIDAANKVPGINIPKLGNVSCKSAMLAEGGILNRPTFVAGEAGAEVVAPLGDLLRMIKSSLTSAISDIAYSNNASMQYSGPQPSTTYNYGGDTYIREYNMTAQSMIRPGALAMEFSAMELAHA
jgi:phage-related protein